MEHEDEIPSSFSTLESAQEKGVSCVPQSYVIPTLHLASKDARVPVIDMAALKNSSISRSQVIQQIKDACHRWGFFQVSF